MGKTTSNKFPKKIVNHYINNLSKKITVNGVLLFGSYAYGQPGPDSDIDLLIIKDTSDRPIDRRVSVRKIVSDRNRRIPFEPLVLTQNEVEERISRGDQFIEEILTEGEILYEKE